MGYFVWHYSKGARELLSIYGNFLGFFWHFFSIGILSRTLIAPWKKDITFSNWRGFRPILALRRIIFNLLSRFIGASVRVPVIIFGLLVEMISLLVSVAFFLFWLLLPVVLLAAAIFLSASLQSSEGWGLGQAGAALVLFFGAFITLVSFLVYRRSRKKKIEQMSLVELSEETWFIRVWNRMGCIEPDENIKNTFAEPKTLEKKLRTLGMSLETFKLIVDWELERQIKRREGMRFWDKERLKAIEPIGKFWHYAYTVNLDRYSTPLPKGRTPFAESYLMGREHDIETMEIILTRPSQNNVLLVGDPGVGKRTLVDLVAKKIKEEKVEGILKDKRVVELELDRIISDFAGDELINELHKIFSEAAFAGNVILVVNDIHHYLSGERSDVSSTLVQYLSLPTFQIIGTTTSVDFHGKVEKNTSVMKYLEKIILGEISLDETRIAMLNFLEKEEKKRVLVTDRALEEIIKLSDQYITESPMPEKAVDILEEVLISWSRNSLNYFVDKDDVDRLFSDRIKISVGEIGAGEQEKLMRLEDDLKKRIIGQDEVVKQIVESMLRARSGISDRTKPVGSFLFLGSTGVGKTETAKALAAAYFGSEDRMIRLDMSEYQNPDSVGRILGEEKTGQVSKFISEVSEKPFSVLLLDEIEKAYPEILNLLLQILDEGWLTDAFGKKVIFKNMIIIATSNVGSEIIKDGIEGGYSADTIRKKVIDHAIAEGIFRPELLNRFERVLFFRSLEGQQLCEVVSLLLEKTAKRVYENKNIRVRFGPDVIGEVIKKGYQPIFGARSIKRFIQDKIEDVLAKKIIQRELVEGEEIEVKSADIE